MIVTEIIDKNILDKEELTALLCANDFEYSNFLKSLAKTSDFEITNSSDNHEAIIEISNYCEAECFYCRLRNDNNKIKRFRLNREEIIEEALKQYKLGKKSILLHSGYDKFYNTDRIAYIIYSIKKQTNVKITLSFGLRKFNEYREWKIAGADSYLLNFISSNKLLYEETKSWGSLDERLLHLHELKRLGYNVGSGSIIGLKDQTISDLADDILLCKKIDLNYINFCYFNKNLKLPNNELIKRVVEVSQILIPDKKVYLQNLIN
jgi:biotin synthase